jgi:hypothetical protein
MIVFLIGLVCFCFSVHLILRVTFTKLSQREGKESFLVTTMKLGRIKFRVRGLNIVQYFANTKGLGKHIDEKTGDMLEGEESFWEGNASSFLWRFYGVRWIGLDSIYTFPIEKYNLKGDVNSELEKVTETAESLYFNGSYLDKTVDAEAKGGLKVTLTYRVGIETVHAGKTIQFRFFLPRVLDPIKAGTRDFVASKEAMELIAAQYEGKLTSQDNSGFINLIQSLNDGAIGNPGIVETIGQKIVSINVLDIRIDPETQKLLEAKKNATLRGEALVEETRLAVLQAKNTADRAIEEARGTSEAAKLNKGVDVHILKGKVDAMQGDTRSLALMEGLGKFGGNNLVLGGNTGVILSNDEGKKVTLK